MKKKVTDKRINRILDDLLEAWQTTSVGYPFYNVPNTIKRARRLIKDLTEENINERKSK